MKSLLRWGRRFWTESKFLSIYCMIYSCGNLLQQIPVFDTNDEHVNQIDDPSAHLIPIIEILDSVKQELSNYKHWEKGTLSLISNKMFKIKFSYQIYQANNRERIIEKLSRRK